MGRFATEAPRTGQHLRAECAGTSGGSSTARREAYVPAGPRPWRRSAQNDILGGVKPISRMIRAAGAQGLKPGRFWGTIFGTSEPCPDTRVSRIVASSHNRGPGKCVRSPAIGCRAFGFQVCAKRRRPCGQHYSAAGVSSTALVWATVQLGSPTLNLAKRRTVMFSPSLPTFWAMRSLMDWDCSLMKGCSSRQTSS